MPRPADLHDPPADPRAEEDSGAEGSEDEEDLGAQSSEEDDSPEAEDSEEEDSEEEEDDDDDDIPIGVPVPTKYESRDVPIPLGFLTGLPADAQPMTAVAIDWARTPLPHNRNRYAVVIDNALSPGECRELLRLCEASVPEADRGRSGRRVWRPAMVSVGGGLEVREPSYRNSDRIIWDQQEVMDRLWARVAAAPGVGERLAAVEGRDPVLGFVGSAKSRWEFYRLNKRMRFLRYRKGQFFQAHCDSEYREAGPRPIKTLFTLHLYLNDSRAENPEAELVGGATSFLKSNGDERVDVNPKAGRVLIFQHNGLYHSGDDVVAGTKYTMRTDIMYERTVGTGWR